MWANFHNNCRKHKEARLYEIFKKLFNEFGAVNFTELSGFENQSINMKRFSSDLKVII